jgi:hypothetical protein
MVFHPFLVAAFPTFAAALPVVVAASGVTAVALTEPSTSDASVLTKPLTHGHLVAHIMALPFLRGARKPCREAQTGRRGGAVHKPVTPVVPAPNRLSTAA